LILRAQNKNKKIKKNYPWIFRIISDKRVSSISY
jgi:hypothetical protein